MAKARRRRAGRGAKRGTLDLMQYAVAGARVRLQELAREAGELFRHFPQLRSESPSPWAIMPMPRGRGRGASGAPSPGGRSGAPRRRRRRQLSAEARAKISAAQKRRWAAHRKKAE